MSQRSIMFPTPPSSQKGSPPSSVVPAASPPPPETLESLLHIIAAYDSGPVDALPLRIHVPFHIYESARFFKRALGRSFTYEYETGKMVIGIPTPLHQAFQRVLSRQLKELVHDNFFSGEERAAFTTENQAVNLRCGRADYKHGSKRKKPAALDKKPDWIFFADEDAKYPTVVAEVGFTEKLQDLMGDAEQWFIGSGGKVRIVILIRIKENRKALNQYIKKKRDEQEALRESDGDIWHSALPTSNPPVDTEPAHDEPVLPDVQHQPSTFADFDPDEYIGPVTAFLEIWRYDAAKNKPSRASPRYHIIPPCDHQPDPIIPIEDLLPDSTYDLSRKLVIKIDDLRKELEKMRIKTAERRAENRNYVLPSSESYVDGQEDEEAEYNSSEDFLDEDAGTQDALQYQGVECQGSDGSSDERRNRRKKTRLLVNA